jgi:hypothetical protein
MVTRTVPPRGWAGFGVNGGSEHHQRAQPADRLLRAGRVASAIDPMVRVGVRVGGAGGVRGRLRGSACVDSAGAAGSGAGGFDVDGFGAESACAGRPTLRSGSPPGS